MYLAFHISPGTGIERQIKKERGNLECQRNVAVQHVINPAVKDALKKKKRKTISGFH